MGKLKSLMDLSHCREAAVTAAYKASQEFGFVNSSLASSLKPGNCCKMKLLLILVLLFMLTECQGQRSHRCKDPSEEHLRNKLLRLAPDSLFLSKQDNTPDITLKKCPASINTTSERMQDRSISPWSYRINEDLNRYPRKIVEAYCLCKGCVTSKANSMVSVPFFKEVPVLQKSSKCKKSRFIYKLRYIRIAQFCICRFP